MENAQWHDWDPEEYLREYYVAVEADERFLLGFLVETARELRPVPVALDFGCGPTVHRLFPLVPRVQEFHLAEYLAGNREAVERWLAKREGHDWSLFTRATLQMEGCAVPSETQVTSREEATRARVTRVLAADASRRDPLGPDRRASYPLVTTHYCADSATEDIATWRTYMRHIASLVQPGGLFLVSALGDARRYRVGPHWFPAADVTARDVQGFLEDAGFTEIDVRERSVPDRMEQGYGSVILARATKPVAGVGS